MSAQESLPSPVYSNTRRQRLGVRAVVSPWLLLHLGLLATDVAGLGAAFTLAYVVRFSLGLPFLETLPHSIAFYSSVAFWAIPVWLILFLIYHLYDQQRLFRGFHEYTAVMNACTAGVMVVIVMSFLDVTLEISRGWLVMVWVYAIAFVGALRFCERRFVRHLRVRGLLTSPAVIVGANDEGRALADQLLEDPGSGRRILGFIDNSLQASTPVNSSLSVLGDFHTLDRLVRGGQVAEAIVATTALTRNELLDLYRTFGHVDGLEIRLSSGLFEILTTGVGVQEVSCVPLVTPRRIRITGVDAVLKTTLDYLGAAMALITLSPILGAAAVFLKMDSPGPVFHRRRVLGRSGKPFDAFKFRTMVINADELLAADDQLREAFAAECKLKRDPRVTRIGRFLRRTSIDELPQLFNVLRGEMSLVGPRMITPDESQRYGKWQLNLLTVKPGLTGPWQVRGRSDIPYDERIRLSMQYVRNYSIWLDLELLLRTVPAVLRGDGAY